MTHPIDPITSITAAGLTEREALVWHTLATEGALHITDIARLTALHRPAVYQTLALLQNKKLVSTVQNTRRVLYRSTGTRSLNAWRASHDRAYAAYIKKIQKHEDVQPLPDDVRIYRGDEIRRVWEMVLEEVPKGGLFYRYDGYSPENPVTMYMPKDYYETIERKKIDRFVITNGSLRGSLYTPKMECASRMLPSSFNAFEQGISQFIFQDKIAFIDFTTKTAYIIQNKALAEYHAQLFRFLFNNLKV